MVNVLFLLFLTSFSSAKNFQQNCSKIKAEISAHCRPPDEIGRRISYCSENPSALANARACENAIMNAWREASGDLKKILSLSSARSSSRQSDEVVFAKTDYRKTVDTLDCLIQASDRHTEFLSYYPTVMRGTPNRGQNREDAPCFLSPESEIKKIVARLDQKILEGARAVRETAKLQRYSRFNERSIASKESLTPDLKRIRGEGRRTQPKKSGYRPSDISGTEKLKTQTEN